MGAVSYPIIAVAENWGFEATLAVTVKVIDELSGNFHTEETWVETRRVFPGQDSTVESETAEPPGLPPSVGKGPTGTVRFVQPETGQTVTANSFRIVALAENWGVDTYMHIGVTVTDVATGHMSYASCRCNTRPPFPGEDSQESH